MPYLVRIAGYDEFYGPYSLKKAKDFARIGAKEGKNWRVVVRESDGQVVRLYHERTGKRDFPKSRKQAEEYGLTAYETPRQFKSKKKAKKNPEKYGWDPKRQKYVEPSKGKVAIFDPEYGRRVIVSAEKFVWQGDPKWNEREGEYRAAVKRMRAKNVPDGESAFTDGPAGAMRDVEDWLDEV